MDKEQIIEKLADGWSLDYAPLSGGQCITQGGDIIMLSYKDFSKVRDDDRVEFKHSIEHGHHIFHGRVDSYGLVS